MVAGASFYPTSSWSTSSAPRSSNRRNLRRKSNESHFDNQGERVHVPETGAWARSGFVPASPRNDPFSSFPTFRSRRESSHPDSRQLRTGLSTANHIDPFPLGGAITVMDAPPARPTPGLAESPLHASGRARARAARREPRMRAGASRPRPRERGLERHGRRKPTRGRSAEPRAVPRARACRKRPEAVSCAGFCGALPAESAVFPRIRPRRGGFGSEQPERSAI